MNYFTLFNIPQQFKINKKLLSKNFYKLQLKFHPDLFLNESESKKKIILEKSININKGYNILKDFVDRAIYLLVLNGFEIKKETLLLNNNIFLVKHFSLYEELDNLKRNSFNQTKINDFLYKIEKKIINYKNKIEVYFEKKNYEKISKKIAQLLFFEKLKDNLKKEHNIHLSRIK